MKFIHMGDVHLGAEPESGTWLGEIRKQEIWDAFSDVISLCEKEQVDLLLIPGDLFHGQPLLQDVKEVDRMFRTLTKTKVVMIAGNHDCLLKTSHYYDVEFPKHVVFLMNPYGESVFFPEWNVEVFGLSYETDQIAEARYDALKAYDASHINILLAHGNINGGDKSVPLHKEMLETAGFDYVALGHLHTRIEISDRIAYTGGFEPFERKESGPKGYIAGEISKESAEPPVISWHFVPHAKRKYVPIRIALTPESTEASVCDEIIEIMEVQGMQHMYVATFFGEPATGDILDKNTVMENIRSRGGILVEIREEL